MSKTSDNFNKNIENYLNGIAKSDPVFAERLKLKDKSIEKCTTYILNQVQKSGRGGFTDNEIYGMALHYYDEDNVDPGNKTSARVVINQEIKLTKEEIAEAKQKAIDDVIREEKVKLRKKKPAVSKDTKEGPTLFK